MPKVYIDSLRLPKGFPIEEYANLEAIQKDGGTSERITTVVNNYIHQKDGLVQGRKDLLTYVEKVIKFPRQYNKVTKGTGTDAKVIQVPADEHKTEQKYLDAFVAAVVSKKFTVQGLALTGTNDEQNEAVVWNYLQGIVDKPYDYSVTGPDGKSVVVEKLFNLVNDIKTPERASKTRELPIYATKGADSIIGNPASVEKWKKEFTKKGIAFDPFDVVPKGTPEEQEATKAANVHNLAKAIVLNEAVDQAKKYA